MLSSVHAIRLSLMRQPPYSPDDFLGVTQFSVFADIFATATDSPYRTFADVVNAARNKPEELKVATTPVGAAPYLAVLLLNDAAGIKLIPIPYKDITSAPLDVQRGDVQFILQPFAVLRSQLGTGLRALAVVSPKRMPYLADVPSVSEVVAKYEGDETWNGIFAPKGTPPDVIDLLNKRIGAILADGEIKKQFLQLGVVASPSTPSELDVQLRSEAKRWQAVIRDQKIPQE
jgi:tripartite-type tricarboxylate transporter receptor subunit TctC